MAQPTALSTFCRHIFEVKFLDIYSRQIDTCEFGQLLHLIDKWILSQGLE